ncbi:MAG: hypothetical protein K940chlam7_00912 [Chlamydiae bacterium]|nr:hypothetical protein [Chlamydiota bacterium]
MKKYFPFLFIAFAFFSLSCSIQKLLEEEDPVKRIVSSHAEKQEKRYQLELVASGAPNADNIDKFSLHYIALKRIKIPEVRKLFVLSVEEFLNMVNADAELRPLLAKHPITIENLKFNIGFGTIDGDFQEPPYIAYAYLADGKICYCYYDNLFGKFIYYDDVEEPYDEALQIVLEKHL